MNFLISIISSLTLLWSLQSDDDDMFLLLHPFQPNIGIIKFCVIVGFEFITHLTSVSCPVNFREKKRSLDT